MRARRALVGNLMRIARALWPCSPAVILAAACSLDPRGTAAPAGQGGAGGGGAGGAGGAGAGPVEPCAAYAPGDHLEACAATYLGGPGNDIAGGVDIGLDGSVVFGGKLTGEDFGLTPATPYGPGSGAILRLSPDGKAALSMTRLGDIVSDIEVDRGSGNLIAAGDFGVASLDPEGALLWKEPAGSPGARVSVGVDGTIAVLAGDTVAVYGAAGNSVSTFIVQGKVARDVAVDGAGGRIVVTGVDVAGDGACDDHEVAFLRAYSYGGQVLWSRYGWSDTLTLCAGTQGRRVAMGHDGKLYFAGEADGAENIFRRRPDSLPATAPNEPIDDYTDVLTLDATVATYFARFDPETGLMERGQFLIAREPDGKSATTRVRSIAADEHGNVLVGGFAACCLLHRDSSSSNLGTALRISGQRVGPFEGGEGYVLIASPDFKRLTWTTWTRFGRAQETTGVAAARGVAAMVAFQAASAAEEGTLITVDPLQAEPVTGSEAFLSVWPAPPPPPPATR